MLKFYNKNQYLELPQRQSTTFLDIFLLILLCLEFKKAKIYNIVGSNINNNYSFIFVHFFLQQIYNNQHISQLDLLQQSSPLYIRRNNQLTMILFISIKTTLRFKFRFSQCINFTSIQLELSVLNIKLQHRKILRSLKWCINKYYSKYCQIDLYKLLGWSPVGQKSISR
ncbi:hypothetical protein pb186bvf_018274 [Paramecium bursaria]